MDYNDGNMREQAIDTIEKLEAAFGQLRAADYQERLIKLIGQLESMRASDLCAVMQTLSASKQVLCLVLPALKHMDLQGHQFEQSICQHLFEKRFASLIEIANECGVGRDKFLEDYLAEMLTVAEECADRYLNGIETLTGHIEIAPLENQTYECLANLIWFVAHVLAR